MEGRAYDKGKAPAGITGDDIPMIGIVPALAWEVEQGQQQCEQDGRD